MRRLELLGLAVAFALACGEKGSARYSVTYPGVAGHEWLPLAGTPHDPSAAGAVVHCDSCHGGNSFAQFECIGCHTHDQTTAAAIHAGVSGYEWTSAGCYRCHPTGTGNMPDHGRFFPIGAGTKHALACSQCHADPSRRADPAQLACASCHAGMAGFSTKHAGVKDFAAESPACVRCHGDAQVDRVAAHATFTIASGSPTHDTACLRCHDANRTGDKAFAADFSKVSCTGCHLAADVTPKHAGVGGYVYATPSCLECHPTGSASTVDHARFFPIGAGSKHDLACSQCHTDPARRGDVATLACVTCHQGSSGFGTKHDAIGGVTILVQTTCSGGRRGTTSVALTPATCLACHADGQVTRVSAHLAWNGGSSQLRRSAHQPAGCVTCHAVMRTDKPFGIDFTSPGTGARQASSGCATCHANGCGGD